MWGVVGLFEGDLSRRDIFGKVVMVLEMWQLPWTGIVRRGSHSQSSPATAYSTVYSRRSCTCFLLRRYIDHQERATIALIRLHPVPSAYRPRFARSIARTWMTTTNSASHSTATVELWRTKKRCRWASEEPLDLGRAH